MIGQVVTVFGYKAEIVGIFEDTYGWTGGDYFSLRMIEGPCVSKYIRFDVRAEEIGRKV